MTDTKSATPSDLPGDDVDLLERRLKRKQTRRCDWCREIVSAGTECDCLGSVRIAELERELAATRAELERCREALRAIGQRVPIMGSAGDYRLGQLHALEACSEVASAALENSK
jgi:hypothetical protein